MIDTYVAEVLNEVRVVELTTVTKDGGLNTRPMSAVFLPGTEQIMVTTSIAYPQKAYNIRRNGKVSILYSDFTGSGLDTGRTVLVQGDAIAPTEIAAPQDIPDFWRETFRRAPASAGFYLSEDFRRTMEWYLWRLRIVVTPDRIHVADAVNAGGDSTVPPADTATMSDRIADALQRYPSAVLCSADQNGYPFAARVGVTQQDGGPLRLEVHQEFSGLPGRANVLWHRHNGSGGEMLSLLLDGTLARDDSGWSFVPERTVGEFGSMGDMQAWVRDAGGRAQQYLARRNQQPPEIDWTALVP